MKDVLELPFDQYQRYRLTADLLGEVRGSAPLSVLDVGGRTALLRGFLPKDRVTLVDIERSGERGLVLGSGAALPFRDESFDAVCAFDTLEHVPPKLRAAFVAECARVAKQWVMLAGPYDAPRVAEAETILQRFLREKLATEHRYLNEHRSHGLPDRAAVEAELARAGGRVKSFGHANLERWLAAMCLSLYLDEDAALRPLAAALHRFYNRELYRSDHAEPVYRHVVVAAFGGAALPAAKDLLDEPRAPRGALAPFTELAQELTAFDRERTAWRGEREGFRRTVADLEVDLAGHRESLAEREQDLEQHKESLANADSELALVRTTFAREVGEHERVAAALKDELAQLAATLEREVAEHKRVISGLESELARAQVAFREQERAHAEALADRERQIGEHERVTADLGSELAKVREHRDQLERDLSRIEGVAAEIQQNLLAANANAERLGADLAAASAENAALRTELRSRWKNLRRGISPKKPAF